jgi:uncharacterized protein YacL
MLKKAAMVVGIVFLVIGVAGFIPGITTAGSDGMKQLLGLFMVDGVHNAVHLLSGAFFLAMSGQERLARLAFQIMAVVYGLVTIIGFIVGSGGEVLGLIPVNTADNILHLVLTLAFLYFGFAVTERRTNESAA